MKYRRSATPQCAEFSGGGVGNSELSALPLIEAGKTDPNNGYCIRMVSILTLKLVSIDQRNSNSLWPNCHALISLDNNDITV